MENVTRLLILSNERELLLHFKYSFKQAKLSVACIDFMDTSEGVDSWLEQLGKTLVLNKDTRMAFDYVIVCANLGLFEAQKFFDFCRVFFNFRMILVSEISYVNTGCKNVVCVGNCFEVLHALQKFPKSLIPKKKGLQKHSQADIA